MQILGQIKKICKLPQEVPKGTVYLIIFSALNFDKTCITLTELFTPPTFHQLKL